MSKLRNSIIGLSAATMLVVGGAQASSTRSLQADALQSSDLTKTFQLPAQSGTSTVVVSAGLLQEAPSGTINGSNTAFTLASTPAVGTSVVCSLDGMVLTQGSGKDYTISGATITMSTAPATGQVLWCSYSKY